MSRCLNLPEDAQLWDVSNTQTIVTTQKGARQDFQKMLRSKGVEVVEFDFLTPRSVMEYCYDRGFLSVMWECGGLLSAPAIASGVIQKVISSHQACLVLFHCPERSLSDVQIVECAPGDGIYIS